MLSGVTRICKTALLTIWSLPQWITLQMIRPHASLGNERLVTETNLKTFLLHITDTISKKWWKIINEQTFNNLILSRFIQLTVWFGDIESGIKWGRSGNHWTACVEKDDKFSPIKIKTVLLSLTLNSGTSLHKLWSVALIILFFARVWSSMAIF